MGVTSFRSVVAGAGKKPLLVVHAAMSYAVTGVIFVDGATDF